KPSAFAGRRPAIIFANSWTLNEYEYEAQARKFAARGYIVLAYSTRGFGGSDGYVSVGGPNDIRDFSTILDWLEDNTRVDVANIGMAGISYGAGLALLALTQDNRIKTVAALSGWGDLEKSLYRNETVQKTWLEVLIGSGRLTGKLDPDIFTQLTQMQERSDIAATRAWAAARSPETFIDIINARKAPIFMENSYLDALFPPLQIRSFYERLEGPKRLSMDEGVHASSAISGIAGLPNAVWDDVHEWMDHWLVDDSLPVKTGVSFRTRFTTDRYKEFPALSPQKLTMKPLNTLSYDSTGHSVIQFNGNKDSGATTGIPLLSDTLDALVALPVVKAIAGIDRRYAAVLESQRIEQSVKVRGAPRLNFTVMPHATPVTLVGYLYDVNALGVGTLLSFSVMSLQDPSATAVDVIFDLNVTAFTLEGGHKLVVAIDTVDSLYTPATIQPYKV
ncbi:MAG: alpha/beta fold hydrolase, partial [Cytophagaceae bacterium]